MSELLMRTVILGFLVATAVVSLPLTFLTQRLCDFRYWLAYPLTVAAVVVVVFALLAVTSVLLGLIAMVTRRYDTWDLRLTRKCAGEPGSCVRHGRVTIWFSGPAELGRKIVEQLDVTRSNFGRLLGKEVDFNRPLRVICFEKTAGYSRYANHWLTQMDIQASVYSECQLRKIVLCDQYSRDWASDIEQSVRYGCAWYFFKRSDGRRPRLWLGEGISQMLASKAEEKPLARLHRMMRASLVNGTDLAASDVFRIRPSRLKKAAEAQDYVNHGFCTQFRAQTWSLLEYLYRDGFASEYAESFRCYLQRLKRTNLVDDFAMLKQDLPAGKPFRVRTLFESHFGFGFDALLRQWRDWVMDSTDDAHYPPPPAVLKTLRNRIIPLAKDESMDSHQRLGAIRQMGAGGYVFGADTLIGLLEDSDQAVRREALRSLEWISGKVLGDEVVAWQGWWDGLAAETRAGEMPGSTAIVVGSPAKREGQTSHEGIIRSLGASFQERKGTA